MKLILKVSTREKKQTMNKQWREDEEKILKVVENGNWTDGIKNMNKESAGTDKKKIKRIKQNKS
jgi:hypothetical protein